MNWWPHQLRMLAESERLDGSGLAVCIQAPTGAGKTAVMVERAARMAEARRRTLIFTSRKILTGQTAGALERVGQDYGILADGHQPQFEKRIQVASMQTFASRVLNRKTWDWPPADLVIIDEAHANKEDVATTIIRGYQERGATINGYTATPVGLGGLYDRLIIGASMAEVRACGAIVLCMVYSPADPDMKGVTMTQVGEYNQKAAVKRIMQCTCFAHVLEQWRELNPSLRDTLLFAPGIPESRWFVEQLLQSGVSAAHIDGDTPADEREQIFEGSKAGSIQVISSCGVLREGFDAPWIRHGILVQPCGALSTFIQLVGRLLRASPSTGKTQAVLQDHSGAWHRHGSPNADRHWELGCSDTKLAKERKQQIQQGDLVEPVRCPKCGAIRNPSPKCHACGYEHTRSVRAVRMTDGTLHRQVGNVVKRKHSSAHGDWMKCLWACAKSGRTLAQASGLYKQRTGRWPNQDGIQGLPDHGSINWKLKVIDLYPSMGGKKESRA